MQGMMSIPQHMSYIELGPWWHADESASDSASEHKMQSDVLPNGSDIAYESGEHTISSKRPTPQRHQQSSYPRDRSNGNACPVGGPSPSKMHPRTARQDKIDQSLADKVLDPHKLQKKLEKALQDKADMQERWQAATAELNRLHSDSHQKVDDNYFITEWRALRYEIKGWAFQHFDGNLSWTKKNLKDMSKPIANLTASHNEYLCSPQLRPLLMQTVLWQLLSEQVFSADTFAGFVWAGFQYSNLRVLSTQMTPKSDASASELKEYHRWRADTARLLQPTVDEKGVQLRVNEVVNSIKHSLAPYVTSKEAGSGDKFQNGLERIVRKAANLDLEFQKSRAHFFPWTPKSKDGKLFGYFPRLEHLESDDELKDLDKDTAIKLLVVPGLVKRGTADGDNYAVDTLLVKCRATQEDSHGSHQRQQQQQQQQQDQVRFQVQSSTNVGTTKLESAQSPHNRVLLKENDQSMSEPYRALGSSNSKQS